MAIILDLKFLNSTLLTASNFVTHLSEFIPLFKKSRNEKEKRVNEGQTFAFMLFSAHSFRRKLKLLFQQLINRYMSARASIRQGRLPLLFFAILFKWNTSCLFFIPTNESHAVSIAYVAHLWICPNGKLRDLLDFGTTCNNCNRRDHTCPYGVAFFGTRNPSGKAINFPLPKSRMSRGHEARIENDKSRVARRRRTKGGEIIEKSAGWKEQEWERVEFLTHYSCGEWHHELS